MFRFTPRHVLMGLSAMVLSFGGLSAARADVLTISDTFSITAGHPVGTLLKNTATEVGSQPWTSNVGVNGEKFVLGGDASNGYVKLLGVISGNQGRNGYVDIAALAGSAIRVQADVHPTQYDTNPGWVAVGFGSTPANSGTPTWANGLYLRLDTGGSYIAYVNNVSISAAAAPGFNATGFNTLAVEYFPVSNTAHFYVNGTKVVNGYSLGAFTPSVVKAGISELNNNNDQFMADNFQVYTAVIPEPATLGLMALGGLMMVGHRR
ncbi:MAG: PEP-CTERM sorting domain-containing protein [Phycisphaerales bacterium]